MLVDRFTWFQMILAPEETCLDTTQQAELIQQYLHRFDEELGRLRSEQRPGRPKSKRIDQIEFTLKGDRDEYIGAGFEIPDLSCVSNVEALKKWDGTRESLGLIRRVRVKPPRNTPSPIK